MKRSAFFYTIFLRYIFLVLLATLAISFLVFYNGTAIRKSQIDKDQKNLMGQARDKMDAKISVVFQFISQFENDADVNRFRKNKDTDYYNVSEVIKKLSNGINTFSSLGFTVAMNKDSDNLMLSPNSTSTIEDYFQTVGIDGTLMNDIENYLSGLDYGNKIYCVRNKNLNTDDKTMVTILLHKKYNDNSTLNYYISFYEDEFFPLIDTQKKESFLIVDENGIIAANTALSIGPMIDELKNKNALLLKTNLTEYNTTSMGYEAYIAKSNVLGDLNYIYLTPKNNYIDTNILLSTIAIFITILTLGIWLAISNTKFIYGPIKGIVDAFKRYEDIDSDKLSEMDFIQKTAATLSRTNEELSRIVSDKSEHLKVKTLTDLLYGMLKYDEIQNLVKGYKLQKLLNPINVIVVELTDPIHFEQSYTKEEIIEIKGSILSFLKERYTEASGAVVLDIDYKRYCIIVKKEHIAVLKKDISNIMNNINGAFNIEINASIGKSVSSLFEVEHSFSDALFLLEHRQVAGANWVITGDDFIGMNNCSYYYPLDIERNLIYYITKGDREKAGAIIKSVLNKNLHENVLNKEGFVEFKFAIAATLKRVLQQLHKSPEEVFGEGSIIYLELGMCKNVFELEKKIKEMFDLEILSIHSNIDEVDQTLINRLTAFVREHYHEDVSLTDLSEQFNVSISYVSRLFKNQMKVNFKDYLNMYRVQRAKEIMIQNKQVQINEVAVKVGYNSTGTFIRIFKRYEGISPGEFVKNFGKGVGLLEI